MDRYTDELIGDTMCGAIIGDNGVLWGGTPGFTISPDELTYYPKVFYPNSDEACRGIAFHGEQFAVISVKENVAVAANSNNSIVLAKGPKFIVIGFSDSKHPLQKCKNAVEKLTDRLILDADEFLAGL